MRFFWLLLFFPVSAWAERSCWNSDRTFYDCSSGSHASAGVSAPVFGDSLANNPANLPTEPMPFGLEFRGSDRSAPKGKRRFDVTLVKGFKGIGFGVGSWSKGTFNAPDFSQHFLGSSYFQEFRNYEQRDKFVPGFRIGSTFVLPRFSLPKFIRISVGGSLGFGQISGKVAPQYGAVMRIYGFGFGYSESFDQLSRELPKTRVSVASAGLFIRQFYMGFAHNVIRSSAGRSFSNSVSARLPWGRLLFFGGWKYQKDHRGAPDDWYEGGLLYRAGKRIALGYEYGYYRQAHSALLQVFF